MHARRVDADVDGDAAQEQVGKRDFAPEVGAVDAIRAGIPHVEAADLRLTIKTDGFVADAFAERIARLPYDIRTVLLAQGRR